MLAVLVLPVLPIVKLPNVTTNVACDLTVASYFAVVLDFTIVIVLKLYVTGRSPVNSC